MDALLLFKNRHIIFKLLHIEGERKREGRKRWKRKKRGWIGSKGEERRKVAERGGRKRGEERVPHGAALLHTPCTCPLRPLPLLGKDILEAEKTGLEPGC